VAKAAKAAAGNINPGMHKDFVYVGNFVPNKISVRNLGTKQTRFRLTSVSPGWHYYGSVPSRGGVAVLVNFPSGKIRFYNDGPTAIDVSGEDLRPM
jgi:hypothetical protein